jgi:hypothetical protein
MSRELLWWRTSMALLVLWAASLSVAVSIGWGTVPIAILAIGLLLAFSYMLEPRRPWWGPEIAAVIQDRVWMRRRLPELVLVLLLAAVGIPALVTVALSAMSR